MTRRRWGLLAALLTTACGPLGSADFPTQSALPDEERRPDGIAVDLASDPPPTRDRAESADELVALRAPLGVDAAHETLRVFFEAMVSEDIAAMSAVLEANAQVQDLRVIGTALPAPTSHGIANLWRQRFRKREYQRFASQLLYREADVITYRSGDLDALPVNVRYLPEIAAPEATDVVLRVPIITHTLNNERMLGDELFFWLRRDGSRYVIYRMAEDIPL